MDFSLYLQAFLYILAGMAHFISPSFFLKIIPKWIPAPKQVNLLVGFVELSLGLLFVFDSYRSIAAWGIILLLIAVFPANVYHFQKVWSKGNTLWKVITALRLPLQGLLIYWAYIYT